MDDTQGQVNQSDQGQQGPDSQSLGWRSALPDEFKEHEFVKTFQKPGDFVKSALDIKTERDMLKASLDKAIVKPDENATPEQKDAFMKALGRPDKPEDYEFSQPSEGKVDDALVSAAKTAFHAAGLNNDQSKHISAWWNTYMGELVKAEVGQREKERNEAEVKLKAELGDKYDESVEMVRRVWTKYSNAEFNSFVNETKIGNDPRLIRFMINLAKLTGEDRSPSGGPGRGKAQSTTGAFVYDKTPPVESFG